MWCGHESCSAVASRHRGGATDVWRSLPYLTLPYQPMRAPYPFTLASLLGVSEHVVVHAVGVVCGSCVWEGGSGVQVAHPRHRAGACTLNAVGLLPVSGRGDARVAPPCPTTLCECVCRGDVYLTFPYLLARGRTRRRRREKIISKSSGGAARAEI